MSRMKLSFQGLAILYVRAVPTFQCMFVVITPGVNGAEGGSGTLCNKYVCGDHIKKY